MSSYLYIRFKDVVTDFSDEPKLADWFNLTNYPLLLEKEYIKNIVPEEIYNHCEDMLDFPNYISEGFDNEINTEDITNCKIDLVMTFKSIRNEGNQIERLVEYIRKYIKEGSIYFKFDDLETRKVDYSKTLLTDNDYSFNYYEDKDLTEEDRYLIEREDVFEN